MNYFRQILSTITSGIVGTLAYSWGKKITKINAQPPANDENISPSGAEGGQIPTELSPQVEPLHETNITSVSRKRNLDEPSAHEAAVSQPSRIGRTELSMPICDTPKPRPKSHLKIYQARILNQSRKRKAMEHEISLKGAVYPAIPAEEWEFLKTQTDYSWPTYYSGGAVFPHPKTTRRNLFKCKEFAVCYDNQTRSPCWTLEYVTLKNITKRKNDIEENREEVQIPQEFRVNSSDYEQVADKFKPQRAAESSFHASDEHDPCVFTNVLPQRLDGKSPTQPTLWDELNYYIGFQSYYYQHILVLTGLLYSKQIIDKNKLVVRHELISDKKIAVPTHFYKVILGVNQSNKYRLECTVRGE